MKKLRLKKWVKVTLAIIVLIGTIAILKQLDDDFMNGCMSAGYSEAYCIAHK